MTPRKQRILKANQGQSRAFCLGISPKKLASKNPLVMAWVQARKAAIKVSQAYQPFTSKASRRRARQIGA